MMNRQMLISSTRSFLPWGRGRPRPRMLSARFLICITIGFLSLNGISADNPTPQNDRRSPEMVSSWNQRPPEEIVSQCWAYQKRENLTDTQFAEWLVAAVQPLYKDKEDQDVRKFRRACDVFYAMSAFDFPEVRVALTNLARQAFFTGTRDSAASLYLNLLPADEVKQETRNILTTWKTIEASSVVQALVSYHKNSSEPRKKNAYLQTLQEIPDYLDDCWSVAFVDSKLMEIDPQYAKSEKHAAVIRKYAPQAKGFEPREIHLRKEARRLQIALPKELPEDP